jgi:hypothetical protein
LCSIITKPRPQHALRTVVCSGQNIDRVDMIGDEIRAAWKMCRTQ